MEIQPTVNNGVALANEMRSYFESIEDSFENSLKDRRGLTNWDAFLMFCVICAIFSAMPAVPFFIWLLAHLLLHFATIKTFAYATILKHSFFHWWIVCAAIFIPLAFVLGGIENTLTKRRKRHLGTASLRFALCYSIVQEINRFSTNRLPKHIDRALDHWRRLLPGISAMVGPVRFGLIDFSPDVPYLHPMIREELMLSRAGRGTDSLESYESIYELYP